MNTSMLGPLGSSMGVLFYLAIMHYWSVLTYQANLLMVSLLTIGRPALVSRKSPAPRLIIEFVTSCLIVKIRIISVEMTTLVLLDCCYA